MSTTESTVHSAEPATHGAAVHVCDICGVNQSSRGKIFTRPAHVWQHKKKRHPEAVNHSSPPNPAPRAAPPQQRPAGRRNGAATPPSASHASHVKFCPHCGFNLAVVHAAIEFINEPS